jgi:hypothetical protein
VDRFKLITFFDFLIIGTPKLQQIKHFLKKIISIVISDLSAYQNLKKKGRHLGFRKTMQIFMAKCMYKFQSWNKRSAYAVRQKKIISNGIADPSAMLQMCISKSEEKIIVTLASENLCKFSWPNEWIRLHASAQI